VTAQLELRSDWESRLYAEHPLVGKIWSSEREEFLEPEQLLGELTAASYLLLGEKHDNPDHHFLQQAVLDYFLQDQTVSGVAFEMMDSTAQESLDNIQSQDSMSLTDLKNYLEWDEEGWEWEFYGTMINAVYQANISLAAANISTATMQQVYAEASLAEIAGVLDAAAMEQLDVDIDESHCGMLPESQFPAMVRVQQSRDYSMAQALSSAAAGSDKAALLVAGNFHIRQDLGVPNYLLASNSSLSREQIIALSFMEVDPGASDPAEYLQQFGDVKAFDYLWFTPAISDEDYCASMRQSGQ